MVIVTAKKSPFDPFDSMTCQMVSGLPLESYIDAMLPAIPDYYDLAVSIDGRLIDRFSPPAIEDKMSIAMIVIPQGGSGSGSNKMVMRIVGAIVIAAASYGTGWAVSSSMVAAGAAAGGMAVGIAGAVAAAAVGIAGSIILSAVLPVQPAQSNQQASSTYAWDVAGNSVIEGGALPTLYGTMRVVPPRISQRVTMAGQTQTLSLLFAVAGHAVDSISGVQINDTDADSTNYPEVGIDPQLGRNDNIVMQGFDDTESMISTVAGLPDQLTTSWKTITTQGTGVTKIGIALVFYGGLYKTTDDGDIISTFVDFQIEYALTSADPQVWTTLSVASDAPVEVADPRWSGGYWNGQDDYGNPQYWIEIEAGSNVPGDHEEGDKYTPDFTTWTLYTDPYVNFEPIYIWHWLAAHTTIIPAGTESPLLDFWRIAECNSNPLRYIRYTHSLAAGQYDVRVKIYSIDGTSIEYINDVYWEYYSEIIEDDFRYPNVSLLAVRAMASGKLANEIPRISCIATRGTVYVYDPDEADWVTKAATNPAWASYDVLVGCRLVKNISTGLPEYIQVGSVPYTRMEFDDFEAWATFCDLVAPTGYPDKAAYTCNLYLDTTLTVRKALDMIGLCGRGLAVQKGASWSCVVEMPESTPVQRFIFNMANIEQDSFAEEWLATDDRANCIEMTYYDATDDYRPKSFEIWQDGYDQTLEEVKKTTFDYRGCTNRNMAVYMGKFLLNCNRYLTLTASWTADIDAIACYPGQIIELQHDVPQFGYGGRLLTGCTTTTLYLDQSVTMAGGSTYQIVIYHQDDDEREIRTVTTVAGSYSTITVTVALGRAPAVDCKYSFGLTTAYCKLMRVLRISRSSEQRRKITAIEFVNDVFIDGATILPGNPSDLRRQMFPPALLSTTLTETWKLDAIAKTWTPYISLVFNFDPDFDYANIAIPLAKIRVYAHSETGDTSALPMTALTYEGVFDWANGIYEYPAAALDKRTLYVTATLINQQGMESSKCVQSILYVDITPQPVLTLQTEIDADKGTAGFTYSQDSYTAYVKWNPAGWEVSPVFDADNPPAGSTWYAAYPSTWGAVPVYPINKAVTYGGLVYVSLQEAGGKTPAMEPTYWARQNGYIPIQDWNSGNNFHNFGKYVVYWGMVADTGDIPAFDTISFQELPGIGDITGPDGVEITDADTLHAICMQAASTAIELKYSESWFAVAVVPFCKNGVTCSLDLEDAGLGLDWEYAHVTTPGGDTTVETALITNAELIITAQPGLVCLNEVTWDYTPVSPVIDGFAIMYRAQPDWWAWQTNAEILSTNVDLGSWSNKIDWAGSGGGSQALSTFGEAYLTWLGRGIPQFYFLVADGSNHELILIDTAKVVSDLEHCITRGVEGTTARTWGVGTWFSYAPCEWIDTMILITDTSQRNLMFSPPLKVDQALHYSMCAYKLLPEETTGYKRSYYAWWDTVTYLG